MTYWEALNFVRKARFIVCPNMGFAKQLQEYEQKLKFQKKQEEVQKMSAEKKKITPQ